MNVLERLMQTRNVLAVMALLQVLWLATVWLTGVTSNWRKIPLLLVYSVVSGVAIGCMPASFVFRIRQIKECLIQNERLLISTLCVVVLIAGVVYANYQRTVPDELDSFNASRMVAEEGVVPFFANYARIYWLGAQHPPLVPLVYGFAMHLLGVNLFVARLVSLAFAIATVLLTYFLGRELYDRNTGLLVTSLLLSFPFFFRNGAAALTDMPVTFFFALALLLTLRLLQTPTCRLSVATGIFIGAGLLSKYMMALIYPVVLSYFIAIVPFRRLKLPLAFVTLVSVSMLITWLVYAYHIGVLAMHKDTVASYASVVMTTNFGKKLLLETLLVSLPSFLGVYNIPMLFLGAIDLMRRRSQSDLFILLWIGVVFLSLSLTLPDHRYFMPAFPALAVMVARGLRRLPEAAEQVIMLALLYCGGVLYLFVDWHRAAFLFFR